MRIGVVARGTHSLHLERGFDTLKRNFSLESRSNIKSWLRVCLWMIRHYDEPIIPRRFLLLLFLTFKNPIFTIKLSSNHLLKVNQIEQLPIGTILFLLLRQNRTLAVLLINRPFGFSVHRDAHFCLSCLFRYATYRAVTFWHSISWLHRHSQDVRACQHP